MGRHEAVPPDGRRRPRISAAVVLAGLWPLTLSVVLLLPLLIHSGYPLARDLAFVPREPLTDASVGLGGFAPRAVPLDAMVALLTSVVDGAVVARVALLLALVLAGWGVLRLTASFGATARLAAAGFAVWNPYVVERMMLGQWALVLAYAAVPWLVLAAARFRRTGDRGTLAAVVVWSGVASLTPSGGLLVVAAVACAGAARTRRTWWLAAVGLLGQLPWLVPAVVGGVASTSDPAGAAAFAPGSDSSGSPIAALVGLGGIWDGLSVPESRHTLLAAVTAAAVALVVVAGARRWWRTEADLAPRLTILGLGGLLFALVLSTAPGQALLRHALDTVPGAGLLRDGQKLLAPFVILVACLLAATVEAAMVRLGSYGAEVTVPVGLLLVLVPVLLIPDAASSVWATVRPVTYPAGLTRVVDRVDASSRPGGVVTLPWRSYRSFSWGRGTTSSDPLVRLLDRPVFTSDDLAVGKTVVRGESAEAARIGAALADGAPAEVLPGLGVGWVVVYRDDPATPGLDLTGLRRVFTSPEVALYVVPGATPSPAPATWRRAAVGSADLMAALLWVVAASVALTRTTWRRGRSAQGTAMLESATPPQEESR